MLLENIVVQQFRNFEQATFAFNPALTIIIGANTRGKTSLLEAIYTVIYGEGFREAKEEELIRWEKDMANVAASFVEPEGSSEDNNQFQVMFRRMNEKVEKNYFVNKTKKTHFYYLQYQTRAVLFTPDNIEIITGSPSERRNYINRVLAACDLEYKKKLQNYENALRKRNKILETYRSDAALEEELSFWNTYLTEQGSYLTAKRAEYVEYLNARPELEKRTFTVKYIRNEVSVPLLEARLDLEKRMRKTSIGPQKDDIEVYLEESGAGAKEGVDAQASSGIMGLGGKKNVQLYGSRSEQRLAMFWLKLNEIRFVEESIKQKPLLLLDDVFSELDSRNKAIVMKLITEYQTVLTTTEEELLGIPDIQKDVIEL